MLSQVTKTIETYEYDESGNVTKRKVVETGDVAMPNDTAIESGIEVESAFEMSPLEVFLTAAAGAVIGNLLYQATHKN